MTFKDSKLNIGIGKTFSMGFVAKVSDVDVAKRERIKSKILKERQIFLKWWLICSDYNVSYLKSSGWVFG